ncbi:MAG: ChaN family lipoprotein, partial [Flammeovirgaceae bacterium]|nr:ChaN family lipoprotein [Flammeovirgaceae bacterium]
MIPLKTLLLTFIGLLMSFSSDKPAYLLFEQGGKKVTYQELLKKASQADVVLFGELHNNPICHWLELELAKDLWQEKKGNLVLGAEMFEADIQLVLNEFLSGKIKENHLETEGKVWINYKTDYSPLVNFAKTKQIPFIATNV